MTWSAVGAWQGANSTALSVSNQAAGNLLVVEVINFSNSTVWCTGLSGGGATWTQAGVKFSGTTNAFSAAVFLGTVTATGAGTATPSWSGTAPASYGIAAREFHSTIGAWAFDKQANLDSAGTSNWPALTAGNGAGELYFGYAANATTAAAGSTSGYVYNANVDSVSNGAAYNVNCPATSTFPAWADAGQALGIVIMVAEAPLVPTATALRSLPPGWFPGADQVTAQPGGVPFWAQPAPTDEAPAVIIPPTPEPAGFQPPALPPGWFPGADRAATEPGGIPFYQAPAPADPSQAILPPPAPDGAGIPDWLPLPPGYFPGSQTVTVDPGGIPFYAQPQPLTPAVPPAPPPVITGLAGSGLAGYFHDQYGSPRILWLEQGWALPWNAGRWNGGNWQSDMDAYFQARARQGYTAWYGIAWGNTHVDSTALSGGRQWDGAYPLLVNGAPGAIATGAEAVALNDPFWQRVDYMFRDAAGNGIACFLNLSMSYDVSDVGGIWQHASNAQGTAFGAALAARYPQAAYPNVFWFFGDDDDGPNDSFYAAILSGITGAGDARGVISMEQFTNTNCHVEFDNGTSFGSGFGTAHATYNWSYCYSPSYFGIESSYAETAGFTRIPPVHGDGVYYGDATSSGLRDATIRRTTWWALASGARGVNNTSGPSDLGGGGLWTWQSDAVSRLTSDPNGSWITGRVPNVVSYFTGLRNWHQLVPDTGSAFITAGRGTRGTSGVPGGVFAFGDANNYVTGSITADGSLAVIYCRAAFSITVNQSLMAPGYTATWVDPSSLATQSAATGSTYSSSGLGNNSAGDPDWALVLQGTPAGVPGTVTVVAPGAATVQAANW